MIWRLNKLLNASNALRQRCIVRSVSVRVTLMECVQKQMEAMS
jgi:hypothetical protein